MTDGLQNLSVTATDPSGNASAPTAIPVTIDTTGPSAPAAILSLLSDTGIKGDGITSDTTPTIKGSGATAGDTITVVMPGTGEILTATVAGDGTWSVTPTTPLTVGTIGDAVVTATDPAGNSSAPTNVPLDIQLPLGPLVAITAITNDTGISSTDGITNDTTPTISGTSDQFNRPITVTIGSVIYTVMTDATGNWSVDTGVETPTSGTFDKAVGFGDGVQNISVSLSDSDGNISTSTSAVTIDATAPTVLITSVFGDTVAAAGNGTFDGTERGFDTSTYTLAGTVSPLPVISGTTTAEDGQTVTVTLNGQSYTAIVAAGVWSVPVPSADAVLLNHGNTYAISASVSDKAGNAAAPDLNNGVVVNIAPPDVPTVVSQLTVSTTPTITGVANKLNGSATVSLATGDALTVVLKDAAGTSTIATYTLIVGSTSSPTGLTYNSTTGAWSLAVTSGLLATPTVATTYNVEVFTTAANLTRSDISSSELILAVPPVITSIPEALTNNSININDAASIDAGQTVAGTPVNVSIANTGAVVGQVITLNWGGQIVTQVLTAADIANNSVTVIVPTSVMQAETPANTTETIAVSVSLGNGLDSTASNVVINFVTPTAPTINSVTWAATGAGNSSDLLGIPEAYRDKHAALFSDLTAANFNDMTLYESEVTSATDSGTIVRVQLPTVAANAGVPTVAGDSLDLKWGDQIIHVGTLTAADITAKYIDVTVSLATIQSQAFGIVPVVAQITSAASGNVSNAAPLNVNYKYDLPTAELTSQANGFAINGSAANEQLSSNISTGSVNVGDVNGDGYDDFSLGTQPGNTRYVIYGRPGLASVEVSSLDGVGNTNGFVLKGNGVGANALAGDVNGDGLNDITVRFGNSTDYVILGSTRSIGLISAIQTLPASDGFKIVSSSLGNTSMVGDVNGDGFDDMLINSWDSNFVLYGSTNTGNITLPSATTGTLSNGFFITGPGFSLGGTDTPQVGDFNGDGYSDFMLFGRDSTEASPTSCYVVFGGSNMTGYNVNTLNSAGSGKGFVVNGVTDVFSFHGQNTGDVNGDGLDDIIFDDGVSLTYVMFGKTSDAPVNLSAIRAGTGGFVINGYTGAHYMDVDMVGDFNGDGLADMVVGDTSMSVNAKTPGGAYLIYGRTSTTALTMTNLAASEGFRIDGGSVAVQMGMSVSAAGDVNGDGFADLLVSARQDSPDANRVAAGITRVIYGGVDRLDSMTFQALNGDAIGTTGADTLTGTAGNNQIVAGDGNDTLIGAGGADVLYGGSGNDTIVINASNIAALSLSGTSQAIARIDGGSGTDTLEITASLDLGTVGPAAIQSIERFNLSASGASLKMGLLDVIGLSEKNNPFNTATGWTATATGGATGWGAVNVGAQVVVDGSATNDLYLGGTWQSIGTVEHTENGVTKTYKVLSDLTAAQAQVLVDSNVKVHMTPTILVNANELANTLNIPESNSLGGTPVRISLADTGSASGNTIQLNWGGQLITVILTATDIVNGYVDLPVPTATLTTVTPIGNSANVNAIVTLLDGTTDIGHSSGQAIAVNFVTPTAPTINLAAWAATGAGNTSSLTGIPEAYYDKQTATANGVTSSYIDQHLYYSEVVASANSGTVMRVQLPTAGVTGVSSPTLAGDTLTVTWGTQTLTAVTLSATDITAKYVDITVPFSTINGQPFGTLPVTAVVTSAASGNPSPAATVNVVWAYDLPTADLTALSGGFAINGTVANERIGYSGLPTGAVNVGDVNGDGYDDFMISALGTNHYVVYGRPGLTTVELSSMSVVGNTDGFILAGGGGAGTTSARAGDLNGDGLNDIIVQVGSNSAYVVYGNTATSPGTVTLTSLAATAGFKINTTNTTANTTQASPSFVGDVNGDGYDDVLFNFSDSAGSGNFLLYGGSGMSTMTLPAGLTGTFSNGFFIKPVDTTTVSGGQIATMSGDFNGDGYSDFVLIGYYGGTNLSNYVYFGGSNLTGINATSLNATSTSNGRGFAINGLTGGNTSFFGTNAGDINGDGMDDMIFNDGSARAFVLLGKTDTAPVHVSSLIAGSGGFVMYAGDSTLTNSNYLYDVDGIGDFNGDGLADMVVGNENLIVNGSNTGGAYVIFGRTSTTALTLNNLAPSEGMRIDGAYTASGAGYTASAAGDVNGDGFADVLIMAYKETPLTGTRTQAGVGRIVFGGVNRINDMVIQASNGDVIGTTTADTLTGTAGNNQIVAGDGNDTITGAGGADVLYGGRGDDTIVINASNITALSINTGNNSQAIARIDGGNGTDTLEITASLDLGTVRPAAIQSIERINMSTSGTSLTMGLLDVIGLSEKNNPFNTATGWTATATGGATGWGTVNVGAQVVVDGTATNDLYLGGMWQSIGTVQHTENSITKTYKVLSDLTSADAQVLVDNSVKIHIAPTVIATANELAGVLNVPEANSNSETPVRISLVDTGAAVGNTIQLSWGGQLFSVVLQSGDITAGYVDVSVPLATLTAVTPMGTKANVNGIVTLLDGTTAISQSGGQPIAVDFTLPTTPIIGTAFWTVTNTTSNIAGVYEAYYNDSIAAWPSPISISTALDKALYYSEVVNTTDAGTLMRVQLPTVAANAGYPTLANDTLTIRWGDQVITQTITATDITNKYVQVLVSQAIVESQTFGNVTVSAEITSAISGNTSLTSPVVVNWVYDLPLADLTSLSQGFQILGNGANGKLGLSNEGHGAVSVGDVNGDGYDDVEVSDITGTRYIVYGGDRQAAVNVSQLTVAGNSFGFVITGAATPEPTQAGDINGDGLNDILIGSRTNIAVIYGSTTSIGQVSLAATMAASKGFKITSTSDIYMPTVVGDVNGDGYDDMLFNNSANFTSILMFGGPNLAPTGTMILPTALGTFSNYVTISGTGNQSGANQTTLRGDFNGDGYGDFALVQPPTTGISVGGGAYVYYGSSAVSAWTGAPSGTKGFIISGFTGLNVGKFGSTSVGDINGDGLDDMTFHDGDSRAFVLFGSSAGGNVSLSSLTAAGGRGFVINAGSNGVDSLVADADVIGDFNGDGLADMVVSNGNMNLEGKTVGGAYVVYGRTSTTPLTLDSLAATDGFRIDGVTAAAGFQLGRTATAAGDVNGDGFADLILATYNGETVDSLAYAGITRVIYGGVDKLDSMTFQTNNGDAIGTTGADVMLGTSGNNQLVAGDGNDTLTGAGGADVLYGGRGNDTVILNADNVAKLALNTGDSQAIGRVDGGSGMDTIQLDGASITLDFTAINQAAIKNVERIDLTGTGDNTVKLSLLDVLGLSSNNLFNAADTSLGVTANGSTATTLAASVNKTQLMVAGDTGDKATITDLASWTDTHTNVTYGTHTYEVYNHNTAAAQLLIDQQITII
jgi:hypothetical protein